MVTNTEDVITYVMAKCLCRRFFFGVRRRVACPECIEGPLSKAVPWHRTPKSARKGNTFHAFCVLWVSIYMPAALMGNKN